MIGSLRCWTRSAIAAFLLTTPLLAQDPSFDGLNGPLAMPAAGRINPAIRDRRICIANQQTIGGAVEMYNLDNNTRVEEINVALLRKLVEKGYLAKLPEDPGWGLNTASHYGSSSSENGVTCRVHGSSLTDTFTNEQSCFANERLIAGAVEMYCLDNNTKIDRINPAVLRTLHMRGYLETYPEDPGQGPDSAGHYSLTRSGNGVTCRVHGQPGVPKAAE